jgi:formate/nitrite transporter FocA (FNT family)
MCHSGGMADLSDPTLDHEEAEEASERRSPSSRVVHAAIRSEGKEEAERSTSALIWSALAAGLSLGFSLVGQAVLRAHLPDAHWRPLVIPFGYALGFLIVILGRQQLFTENTLTPILPLLEREVSLRQVARLWGLVLMGNLVGALVFAVAFEKTGILADDVKSAAHAIGHEALTPGFALVFLRGVVAGWLIALIVWLLPAAESAHVWIIVAITWLIGVAHFSHVIAGSIDVFVLACNGAASWGEALGGFTCPALLGNIIGGVTLVAFLNHAQVKSGGG